MKVFTAIHHGELVQCVLAAEAEDDQGLRYEAARADAYRDGESLMRLAFEGYIRDRHHRVDMSDMQIHEIIEEWLDVAREVQNDK